MKVTRLFGLPLLAAVLHAHIGSPDVFLDTQAGPYKLFISIRPPIAIPGVAEVQVRAEGAGVREIEAAPVPLTRTGTQFSPVADKLKPSVQDPQYFTGSVWMMASGSWQIRLRAMGSEGLGLVAVPIPSVALKTQPMQPILAFALFCLLLLLIAGVVLMVGASVREAKLAPGRTPAAQDIRRARLAMAITLVAMVSIVALGLRWWKAEEESYRRKIYKPLEMAATLSPGGVLTLRMSNPEWMNQPARKRSPNGPPLFSRVMDDLIPDHDHLMHLYAIRQPGMDAVYHLHPKLVQTGLFQSQMPLVKAGTYWLYADIVHENGFAETMVSQIRVPSTMPKKRLSGDDAGGVVSPWRANVEATQFILPDGYVMQWIRPAGMLHARNGIPFRFCLLDGNGHAASPMELYMGMPAHAAFVKTDGSTFAHVHPTGSVAMASYMMAERQLESLPTSAGLLEMPGMDMSGAVSNEVTFPYGFPTAGQYRIIVQMKRAGTIETGVFDALVSQ